MSTQHYVLLALAVGFATGFVVARLRVHQFNIQNRGEVLLMRRVQNQFPGPGYHLLNHVACDQWRQLRQQKTAELSIELKDGAMLLEENDILDLQEELQRRRSRLGSWATASYRFLKCLAQQSKYFWFTEIPSGSAPPNCRIGLARLSLAREASLMAFCLVRSQTLLGSIS